jgi:hypothetical protein
MVPLVLKRPDPAELPGTVPLVPTGPDLAGPHWLEPSEAGAARPAYVVLGGAGWGPLAGSAGGGG